LFRAAWPDAEAATRATAATQQAMSQAGGRLAGSESRHDMPGF
jgi:hypothetical protein